MMGNYDTEVAVGLLASSGAVVLFLAGVVAVELVQRWRRSR